jgi:ribosomal silencing factor RsfS
MVDLLLRAVATIEPQPITAFIDYIVVGEVRNRNKVSSIASQFKLNIF